MRHNNTFSIKWKIKRNYAASMYVMWIGAFWNGIPAFGWCVSWCALAYILVHIPFLDATGVLECVLFTLFILFFLFIPFVYFHVSHFLNGAQFLPYCCFFLSFCHVFDLNSEQYRTHWHVYFTTCDVYAYKCRMGKSASNTDDVLSPWCYVISAPKTRIYSE